MSEDNKIIDLMKYRRKRALEIYNRLDPELKQYAKSIDKNLTTIIEKSLNDIPDYLDNIDDIAMALEQEEQENMSCNCRNDLGPAERNKEDGLPEE